MMMMMLCKDWSEGSEFQNPPPDKIEATQLIQCMLATTDVKPRSATQKSQIHSCTRHITFFTLQCTMCSLYIYFELNFPGKEVFELNISGKK